jgi:hypothetical protein
MPTTLSLRRKRVHSIVPRSLLAYAGVGLGLGVVPLSTVACDSGPDVSVGIRPAMDIDGDISDDGSSDALPETSIGIRPAMGLDGGSDATDLPDNAIGIAPAMNIDADVDASTDDGSDGGTTTTGADAGVGP